MPTGVNRLVPSPSHLVQTRPVFDFTDAFLQLRPGSIKYYPADLDSPVAGTWSITIPLAPFSADDRYEPTTFRPGTAGPELIETEIRLDFIELPAEDLAALSERTFAFPVNPEEGYIDGSVYLLATHAPVEVVRIDFGQASGHEIPATLHAELVLDTAEMNNRTAVLDTMLRFERGRLASAADGP
jgi:hypothetical protein